MKLKSLPSDMKVVPSVYQNHQKKETLLLEQMLGENFKVLTIEKDIVFKDKPLSINRIQGVIKETSFYLKHDKIIFKGKFEGHIVYFNKNNNLCYQPFQSYFRDFMIVPGAMPNMNGLIEGEVIQILNKHLSNPKDVGVELEKLRIKIYLRIKGKVSQHDCYPVVLGGRCLSPFVKPVLVLAHLFQGFGEKDVVFQKKISLPLPMKQIKSIKGKINGFSTRTIKNKVIIKGNIQQQICSIRDEERPYNGIEDIPFETIIEIKNISEISEVKVNLDLLALNWRYNVCENILSEELLLHVAVAAFEKKLCFLFVALGEQQPFNKGKQIITKKFLVDEVKGMNTILLQKQLSFSIGRYVTKIIDHDSKIVTRNISIVSDGVFWEGELQQRFVFLTVNNELYGKSVKRVFNTFVPLAGVLEEHDIKIITIIENLQTGFNYDRDGLLEDIDIDIFVVATKKNKADIVIDVKEVGGMIRTTRWLHNMYYKAGDIVAKRINKRLFWKR